MRALEPTQAGHLTLAGFQIGYEVFGDAGARPVLLLPTWQIAHRRIWRMQVPYLARSRRVITFDGPGNGEGERTLDPAAFAYEGLANQALGLLDHLGVVSAEVISFSRGCVPGLLLAACHPERVTRLVLIGNAVPAAWPSASDPEFWERRETYAGWQKANAHYWREHYRDWLEFFFGQIFSEPHSTKGIDDGVAWGLETTPEILIGTVSSPTRFPTLTVADMVMRVRCPVLLIHGVDDQVTPIENAQRLLALRPEWEFAALDGCGHAPLLRDPVQVNGLLARFLNL